MAEKILPPAWIRRMNAVLLAVHRVAPRLVPMPILTVPGRPHRPAAPHPGVGAGPRRSPLPAGRLPRRRLGRQRPAAGAGTLGAGRLVEHVRLVEIGGDEAVAVLRAWPVEITPGAKIMRDNGVVPDLEPDSFAALLGRCAVFRIETG